MIRPGMGGGPRGPAWRDAAAAHPFPVGAVIPYAGRIGEPGQPGDPAEDYVHTSLARAGWLPCDGRPLAVGQYLELFASLGYQYGGRDGTFQLPDLRGYFLRGADLAGAVDQEANARTPLGKGKAADVGSRQGDALRNHVHLAPVSGGLPAPAGPAVTPSGVGPEGPAAPGPPAAKVNVSAYETRPVNVSMHYLIRFTSDLRAIW